MDDGKQEVDLFHFMHTMDLFNSYSVRRWNSMFQNNLGITPIIVLSELRKFGPLRGVELAKKLELTPGAITNITNKLYEKDLISRTPDPNSRRSIYYSIKQEGLEVLREAKETAEKMNIEILQVLTEEEQKQMLAIYTKVNEYFAKK
ncbi:MarR family transcriptional regulator [Metabacillus fastidiosus]|uniref:MarR family winged helix-turn-helix transcriptional regulator n=1 Tax=Metabacillus fastidiosus TaxID=1458 RepID=UPI002E23F515|nr:MarR family transcriptional regulator [Metabacillus fastidiosus]MED4534323.1 MarR family transcriptional regulator [Metabacillus fastidiosus]